MKSALAILFFSLACAAQPKVLTNADVVRMCQQGTAAAAVIQAIKQAPAVEFRISPDYQPDLLKAGVPQPVLDAMIDRVMHDQARSNYSWPEKTKPQELEASSAAPSPGRYGWGLMRGHPEVSGFVGANAGPGRSKSVQWSAGGEVQVGLIGPMSVWGDYAYNRVLSESVGALSAKAGWQEGFVGLAMAAPTRISPYLAAGVGIVRGVAAVSAPTSLSVSESFTRAAEMAGVGFNFGITHHAGVRWDLSAVVPDGQFNWYVRSTVGIYGRF
jgi:hypothetical protein